MEEVTYQGLTFEPYIRREEIAKQVNRLAQEIKRDYDGKNPLFLCVLNGAFIFAADLLRMISIPCQIAFTKISSYQGTTSTENITEHMGVTENLSGRHVIIIEDIVESGYSMQFLKQRLRSYNPASIEICALFHKPESNKVPDLTVKYVGMELPNAFIVGYGLDYNDMGRSLRDIYSLVE